MATSAQIKKFLKQVIPMFQKYGAQYKFHIISFAIAQACYESAYGTSAYAKNQHNILGIGPGKNYSSWDACVKGYYTDTVLGKSKAARDATTLDQYYAAFVASNYCPGTERSYYAAIKSIINANGLKKYDAKKGKTVSSSGDNALQKFLDTAYKHSNKESFSAWVKGKLGLSGNPPWCGYFVCACAKEAGVLGKLIYNSGYVPTIMDETAKKLKGKKHSSSSYTPQPGDLVSERYQGESVPHHISIVAEVHGRKFTTYDGNHTGGLSNRVSRSLDDSNIYVFVHPNWESVGGYSTGASSSSSSSRSSSSGGGSLYDSEYTRDDALIREVAYINTKSYKRTTTPSSVHLSVMNYTDMLAELWKLYGTGGDGENEEPNNSGSSGSSDTSKLKGNAKTTIDFLIKKGLNAAGACGFAGNIFYESNFNPGAVNSIGASGIVQWLGGRADNMKKYVGSNWKSNLSGQLGFLWHELTTSYKDTYNYVKSVKNSTAGAKNAAEYVCRHYEIPGNFGYEVPRRSSKAAEYFSLIKTNGAVADGTLTNKQKKVINAANNTPSPGADLCAMWVTNVFKNAGIGTWGGNACDQYRAYCKYKDKSKLKPGMIVAVDSWNGNAASVTYGHVGIYIGNNKVRDNIGHINESTLDQWINYYQSWPKKHPVKWGWFGNVNLTK